MTLKGAVSDQSSLVEYEVYRLASCTAPVKYLDIPSYLMVFFSFLFVLCCTSILTLMTVHCVCTKYLLNNQSLRCLRGDEHFLTPLPS